MAIFPTLYRFAKRTWHYIVNVGVYEGMPFIESRRTKLLNLITIPCIPFMFYFGCLNVYQGRYLLSIVNFTTTSIGIAVFFLHQSRRYVTARFQMIILSILLYTFTGVYFHNGSEYFLLNILIVSILVYDHKWIVTGLSMLIITAFLFIIFMPQDKVWADPVPTQRVWVNVGMAISFIAVALAYFKYIQSDYQKEIEHQRQALANMNKDKEKLFSIVAHDIRSPLATLEVLLEMFQKGEYPEKEMVEAAAALHQKVSQLGGTLDNLLRWSTKSMKGIQTQPQDFLIDPLLNEVIGFFQMILQQKNIQLLIEHQEPVAVYADRDQVSVILRNVLSNAIKFSPAGSQVKVAFFQQDDLAIIEVMDHGQGMSSKQLKSLFTFNSTPSYGTHGERGSGLGLMLCIEFIKSNNGTIDIQSKVDQGTRIRIGLPKGNLMAKMNASPPVLSN